MKKYQLGFGRLAFLLLGFFFATEEALADNRPVLAVHYVVQRDKLHYRDCGASRAQVITELVKKYDCWVAGRVKLYDLDTENVLKSFNAEDLSKFSHTYPVAADYAVASKFISREKSGVDGYIEYVDLTRSDSAPQREPLSAPSHTEYPSAVAAGVANSVGLQNRKIEAGEFNEIERVWAVLPFFRFDLKSNENAPEDLATWAEQSLQTSNPTDRIVERKALDKILDELKLSALNSVEEGDAGLLSRLVGADCMVMGTVDARQNGFRLDIHVVDAKYGIILAADSVTCTNQNQLPESTAQLLSTMTKNLPALPKFRISNQKERHREADYCFKAQDHYNMRTYNGRDRFLHYNKIMAHMVQENAEAAYVLSKDDPERVYRAARMMHFLLLDTCVFLEWGYPEDVIARSARLIEKILAPLTDSPENLKSLRVDPKYFPEPLLLRAQALLHLGKIEKAEELIERHISEYPSVDTRYAKLLKAKCLMSKGFYAEAGSILEQVDKTSGEHRYLELCQEEFLESVDDNRVRYELLKRTMNKGYRSAAINGKLYLDLLQKLESPEYVLRQLNDFIDGNEYIFRYCTYDLLIAKVKMLRALNRKPEAALLCKHLKMSVKENALPVFPHKIPREYRVAEALLKKTEQEIGPIKDTWKSAADTRPFPKDLQVCIVQIGDDPRKITQGVAKHIEEFLGANVSIIQTPTPKEAQKKSNILSYEILWNTLQKTVPIPDNCAILAYLSALELDDVKDAESPSGTGNPVVMSRSSVRIFRHHPNGALQEKSTLAKTILISFRQSYARGGKKDFPFKVPTCKNFPCIFSKPPFPAYTTKQIFLMCPKCQEEYKKINFQKLHREMKQSLHNLGATITSAAPHSR